MVINIIHVAPVTRGVDVLFLPIAWRQMRGVKKASLMHQLAPRCLDSSVEMYGQRTDQFVDSDPQLQGSRSTD